MTGEGQFPKVDGDAGYASEANRMFFFGHGKEFTGDGTDGALSVAAGTTTLTGNYYQYTTISVANGATLTFSSKGKVIVKCQGDCTISGTVNLPARTGDKPTTWDGGAGGDASEGTPGIASVANIGVAVRIPLHSYLWEGNSGGTGGGANVDKKGGAGGGGGANYGAGGAGGIGGNTGAFTATENGSAGGAGKGTIRLYIGGDLTINSTASISGAGTAGTAGVDGRTSNYSASGGGGGGAGGNFEALVSGDLTTVAGATIALQGGEGGKGGDGTTGASNGGGGGGASGGNLYLACSGTLTHAATVSVVKGAGGAKGDGSGGGGGVAGSAGEDGTSVVISRQYTIT